MESTGCIALEHISMFIVVRTRSVHTGDRVRAQLWTKKAFYLLAGPQADLHPNTQPRLPFEWMQRRTGFLSGRDNEGQVRLDRWQRSGQSARRHAEEGQKQRWRKGTSHRAQQGMKSLTKGFLRNKSKNREDKQPKQDADSSREVL